MNIINKAGTVVKDFFRYWKKPASGNYVSNKEVIAYSVGGMGVQFIVAVSSQILLQANCLLIGSVYGLKPTDLALLLMINTIISIVIQPFKSWLIDNTPGILQNFLSRMSETDASMASDKKLNSQFLFQRNNLLGQGGLGHIQFVCRGGKMSLFRHRDRKFQLLKGRTYPP